MRSPYMDILEAAGTELKEFVLPSRYEAGIAVTCVRSLAQKRGVENLQVRLLGSVVLVWIGSASKVAFHPPLLPKAGPKRRGRGRPLGTYKIPRVPGEGMRAGA